MGRRLAGVWVIRPGEPACIALPKAGKATLRWTQADGQPAAREVVVMGPMRVAL